MRFYDLRIHLKSLLVGSSMTYYALLNSPDVIFHLLSCLVHEFDLYSAYESTPGSSLLSMTYYLYHIWYRGFPGLSVRQLACR